MLKAGSAGPRVSVQDGDRNGAMRFGVPASGAMDRGELAIANRALGRDAGAAGIEISLGGLGLHCTQGALTLAVAGGALFDGQTLILRNASLQPAREGDLPVPDLARPLHGLRVTPGPQDRYFPPEAMARFLAEPFTLSDAYDRMGVRLTGPLLTPQAALSIPSEPIARGAVQVSGDGVATVLLADHQTTGGYPKIATVVGCDLDGLAQCRCGDAVRFVQVTPPEAIAAAHLRAAQVAAYLDQIAQPRARLAERLLSANLISGVVDARPGDLS